MRALRASSGQFSACLISSRGKGKRLGRALLSAKVVLAACGGSTAGVRPCARRSGVALHRDVASNLDGKASSGDASRRTEEGLNQSF